ncbi:MAG: hypothetical protein WBF71_10360 [Microthrixaceae bacterium]
MITAKFDPLDLDEDWSRAMESLSAINAVERLWSLDHTVVQEDPDEVANRLGWLEVTDSSRDAWPRWVLAADEALERNDYDDVVVLGMGGSSLFPEVLAKTFEPGDGFPRLTVLDSTDPAAVARVAAATDPERTFVLASSKSGSTVETRSHLAYFWSRQPFGRHFAVVTDPGSALEQHATDEHFRFVAHGVPEIGGRYSALSAFGMFPAALMGLDGVALLDTADEAAEALGADTPVEHHMGAQLGAFLAVGAANGRDKVTFIIEDDLAALGSWLEQLLAESTGKQGKGLLPVVGEAVTSPDPDHRVHVFIGSADFLAENALGVSTVPSVRLLVEEPQDLGAQLFLWEFATAIAGIVMGINPFDQPDVESAKRAAREILASPGEPVVETSVDDALSMLRPGDALVIGAFVDPALEPQLQKARRVLGDRAGVPTTFGIGPRFLHSTGQCHKGGPDRIVMMQVVSDDPQDLPVPGEDFTFGELKHAQADGDLAALKAAGKRAVRVPLADLLRLA